MLTSAKVLVGYDASPESLDALALGELLAVSLGARLILGLVHAPDSGAPGTWQAGGGRPARRLAEETLEGAPLARFRARDVERLPVSGHSPARGLHDLAVWRDVDLVVVGSTGRGAIGRVLPGSVGRQLLHGAPCPVAIAPRGYRDRPASLSTIVSAFDGTPDSAAAVGTAADIALAAGGLLRVVSIIDAVAFPHLGLNRAAVLQVVEANQRDKLSDALGRLPDQLRTEFEITRGYVVNEILHAAESADLLVLGSRGYGPMKSVLLGSVASQVADCAPCPLLVVPRGLAEQRQAARWRAGGAVAQG